MSKTPASEPARAGTRGAGARRSITPGIRRAAVHPLDGRVVVVTGGAQGIGRGIAQAVLGAGGCVVICDRDRTAGRACLAEWDVGERARFVALDTTREAAVSRAFAGIEANFGRIDGLVNNAGPADPEAGPIDRLTLARWRHWIDGHLTGAFLCTRAALPALRAARGAIVNIASTRAHQSEPHTAPYAAAKGALVAFTHALAIDEGPTVRANAISPGWIATDAWRRPAARRRPALSRRDQSLHPVGRVGTPGDIGALAVYLLGADAGFVTGQEFTVDGGVSRRMRYD